MHRFLLIISLLFVVTLAYVQAQANPVTVWVPLVQAPSPTVAGYLGSAQDDTLVAAGFATTGALVLAGNVPALAGAPETIVPGGGAGALIHIAADGRTISRVVRVAATLNHAALADDGSAVACGPDGVIVLEPDLATVRWRVTPGAIARCAIGADGRVAALRAADRTVLVYPPAGGAPLAIAVACTAVADIALDAANGLLVATGYTQAASDLKVAFLRAYRLTDGSVAWQRYGFSAAAVKGANLTADSEGRRLALGADSMLYFAGFTDGGNSIFGRDPADLSRVLSASELITFDQFNNPFNLSGAKSLAWYGRFDPATGALLRGQWLLTRLSDGKGNSITIRALAAAADGTLLVVGDTACCLQGRSAMQLFGQTLGNYELGEPFALVVSPDFGQRRLWTALAAPGATAGSSPAIAAALTNDRLVLAVNVTPNTANTRALVTVGNPVFATSNGGSEGYYLLMARP
ncbi:hypothetical protein A6A03_04405 [Chloroflexus islandicus]|uniref:Pyrrolo-quinoline quinone n=1 Tax=Chloroflexus islandicus TaxID=1707952 RepID=A0A178M1P5_9CHLR|nr:hypothetical protein [Chloroflexus islandicus]OAN40557.1 hypothetical protein A6A03_04405 [Chloroflexus islandicus]